MKRQQLDEAMQLREEARDEGLIDMELIFIRHGHGEHLSNYPHRLHTLHPGLTQQGKDQVQELRQRIEIGPQDVILVSPMKRTIDTALKLTNEHRFIVTPFVGPRMFPQNPEYTELLCDQIYTEQEVLASYSNIALLDFDTECWKTGINKIPQAQFEVYATQLLNWIRSRYEKAFIISHDGTITKYRTVLGETDLTRDDFLGEAGIYKINI
ncbi:histidine phosphatase family protein [Saccharibacillus sp. JS10]|uniref:histidine phosphatase family protein n=1 Tax=Saccharibacillus sp. JS10 TaxID=2950552 RepID=UPI00210F0F78|nr:phosphoglycerate mutase family protein [Saccharibacillus sp. JS10]MCQ4088389.1 histidine phosphatase family protein [Saccharibacillus sp. JS10]